MKERPTPELKDSARLLNFLLGEVMKKTDGRASPHLARQLLLERLDIIST